MRHLHPFVCVALAVASATPLADAQDHCVVTWSGAAPTNPEFYIASRTNFQQTTFDDGLGRTVYLATPNGPMRVRRWRNNQWELLPNTGFDFPESGGKIKVLNDGTGEALYYKTGFDGHVGRWNGAGWTMVNPKMWDKHHRPKGSFDLGNGVRIYGEFAPDPIDAPNAMAVGVWDGANWTMVGESLTDNSLIDFAALDHGEGPMLYAFGEFHRIGKVRARGFARWDGTRWTVPPSPGRVNATWPTVFDDGTGPAIFVFGGPVDFPPPRILGKWDGHTWTNLGGAVAPPGQVISFRQLHVFDDGRGPALYIGGAFHNWNGMPAANLVRYARGQFEAVGGSVLCQALGTIDDARGSSLLITHEEMTTAAGGVVDRAVMLTGCALPQCYADCNRDRLVNVSDLICYMTAFARRDPYANCTVDATIDVADFVCYQKFAAGCGP